MFTSHYWTRTEEGAKQRLKAAGLFSFGNLSCEILSVRETDGEEEGEGERGGKGEREREGGKEVRERGDGGKGERKKEGR